MCIQVMYAFTRVMLPALCAAFLATSYAGAQQPTSPATDGRPPGLADSPLAPNPPALLSKPAAAIALDKIELPQRGIE